MTVRMYHTRIVFSCPCGRDHDLQMFGAEVDPIRIVAEEVAGRLARHCKTVRLTTWEMVTDDEGWTTVEDEREVVFHDGVPKPPARPLHITAY